MRGEQPTKCFVTTESEGEVLPVKLDEALTVPRLWFCCSSLLPVFGVKVWVTLSGCKLF